MTSGKINFMNLIRVVRHIHISLISLHYGGKKHLGYNSGLLLTKECVLEEEAFLRWI